MAAVQRLRQGVRALFAFMRPVDIALAAQWLTPAQMGVFRAMRRTEQLHSLNVLRDLLRDDVPDLSPDQMADLAIAALLHDAGKSRYPMAVWQKTAVVLTRRFLPGLYVRWSRGDPMHFWPRPFVVAEQHPAWSADMAAAADTSERALWLIAHHAEKSPQVRAHLDAHLLKRLQRADDAN